jgi:hypothetical protein
MGWVAEGAVSGVGMEMRDMVFSRGRRERPEVAGLRRDTQEGLQPRLHYSHLGVREHRARRATGHPGRKSPLLAWFASK